LNRLPGEVAGTRFLRALARFGWHEVSQRGSHRKLAHPARPGFLLVAFHSTIGRVAMQRALRAAEIDEGAFLREL
jgi:predicted RNA binding protein YcfA (HicA-like mRNA interferase family)